MGADSTPIRLGAALRHTLALSRLLGQFIHCAQRRVQDRDRQACRLERLLHVDRGRGARLRLQAMMMGNDRLQVGVLHAQEPHHGHEVLRVAAG